MPQNWFATWFNTPYYHLLYSQRNHAEAHRFIDALFTRLNPPKNATVLDLACGRGRHAIYINQKGYRVTGVDLSEESIEYAKMHENSKLRFRVKDMRENLGNEDFDLIFNLFTSFGYFENPEEDQLAMNQIARALKPNGTLVIDFMNAQRVAENLVPTEHVSANDISFAINRFVDDDQIVKDIQFTADGRAWHFQERVRKLTLLDFETLLKNANLVLKACYGSLDLQPFDAHTSDRLIIFAQKA